MSVDHQQTPYSLPIICQQIIHLGERKQKTITVIFQTHAMVHIK